MKRKIQVTVESSQTVVLRSGPNGATMWCDECRILARFVPAERAALLASLSLREICRRVDASLLHFTETSEGRLFICLHSLLAEPDRESIIAILAPGRPTSEGEPTP